MPASAVDLLVLGALGGLLVVAFVHPRPRVELAGGLAVAALLLATGSLPWWAARSTVDRLLPVVLFLSSSLVVAEVCAAEGVFRHLGSQVRRIGRGRPRRMLAVTTAIAALVTALLSLDATVVMLTPVVLAGAGREAQRRPLTHVCVRMANSASLLLPVSNLTNLLVLPVVGLGFVQWAEVLAVPWLAVVLVEYAGVRLFFRADLAAPPMARSVPGIPADRTRSVPPRFAFAVLAVMLLGFAAASGVGIEPFWVSGVAALVLAGHALHRRTVSATGLFKAAHVSFAVFVLALSLAVAAAGRTFLADVLTTLLDSLGIGAPDAGGTPTLLSLILLVALSTALANLVNNLPAVLLLLPVVAPWGTLPLLVVLVGVNVGAGLTYPGSLANLLWRRVLVRAGAPPSARTFHLQAAGVVPVALAVGVCALWAEAALGWLR